MKAGPDPVRTTPHNPLNESTPPSAQLRKLQGGRSPLILTWAQSRGSPEPQAVAAAWTRELLLSKDQRGEEVSLS